MVRVCRYHFINLIHDTEDKEQNTLRPFDLFRLADLRDVRRISHKKKTSFTIELLVYQTK